MLFDTCKADDSVPLVRVVPRTELPPDEPIRLTPRPGFGAVVGEGTPMTADLGNLLSDLEQRRREQGDTGTRFGTNESTPETDS